MNNGIQIENIEKMRTEVGIDDAELRTEIRRLQPGDCVRLTVRVGANSPETVLVRVTSISGSKYSGEFTGRPSSAALKSLGAGAPVSFIAANIHSVSKMQAAPTT